jgi:hypothetical protein
MKEFDTAIKALAEGLRTIAQGVDGATLAKKTGFDNKKVANIVFKLRKMGKIKSVSKGVYAKV